VVTVLTRHPDKAMTPNMRQPTIKCLHVISRSSSLGDDLGAFERTISGASAYYEQVSRERTGPSRPSCWLQIVGITSRFGKSERFAEKARKIRGRAVTISTAMTESRSHRVASGSVNNTEVDWQAVLAQHDRWLRTIVYSRLGDREAVDEVMQEVALAVVRQSSPLSDASKIAPWLYRLAVRHVLLFRRKSGRQRKLLDRYAKRIESAVDRETSSDPLEWLLSSERRELVRVAVERLAPLDAEVLLLKYTEHWSYDEIARHLGVSHAAVESRLHRARNRLREGLSALEIAEVRK